MKSLGYLISTMSVLLLGVVAWPKPGDPPLNRWLVVGGMTASILGMFLRFLSHRKEKRVIEQAKHQ